MKLKLLLVVVEGANLLKANPLLEEDLLFWIGLLFETSLLLAEKRLAGEGAGLLVFSSWFWLAFFSWMATGTALF